MMFNRYLILILTFFSAGSMLRAQSFEGTLEYVNYTVIQDDTVESSWMSYWIKDHLYKHKGYVSKMPFVDLGTLYADAQKMTRTNIDNSGKVEHVPLSLDESPDWKLKNTGKNEDILGMNCAIFQLINRKTENLISSLWVTTEIKNDYTTSLAELFNGQNTLFPHYELTGWVLKREDYRRDGEIFVTEIKNIQKKTISLSEMTTY